jgi:endonuclease YncB( thermonuclease family)
LVLEIAGLTLVLFVAGACLMAEQPQGTISVPCEVIEVYDGDTMTVRVSVDLRVRLLDCWAPELKIKNTAEKVRGVAAMEHLRKLAPNGSKAQLTIPLNGDRLDDILTLGRVLGRVSVDGKDLSEQQVKAGHARTSK